MKKDLSEELNPQTKLECIRDALRQVELIQQQVSQLADTLRVAAGVAAKRADAARGTLVGAGFNAALEIVERVTGVPREKIVSRDKHEEVKMARFWTYWILFQTRNYSSVGLIVGRDHGTVMHGIKRIGNLIETKDRITVETHKRILSELAKQAAIP